MTNTHDELLTFDHFMAYANLIKELRLFNTYPLNEIWHEHLAFLETSDQQRLDPASHAGFRSALGGDWGDVTRDRGIVGITMHFGAYRHAFVKFVQTIREHNPSTTTTLVVDQESFDLEQRLEPWNRIYEELNVHFVVAEHAASALRIVRHLKKGGAVVVYLDGLTGAGQDESPITVPFVSHPIHLRSGLFRLLSQVDAPAVAFIPESNDTLVYSPPLQSRNPEALAEYIMSFFRRRLLAQPAHWRLWYRHHRYINQAPIFGEHSPSNTSEMIRCADSLPHLLLDTTTGDIYEDLG